MRSSGIAGDRRGKSSEKKEILFFHTSLALHQGSRHHSKFCEAPPFPMAHSVNVTRLSGSLVGPSSPAPSGSLALSSMDRCYPLDCFVDMMLVFRHGTGPAELIKRALSGALVHYYPLAGRLERSDGVAAVACTGDGVWFVEATADCSLRDVDWLETHPLIIPKDDLLPLHQDRHGMMVMMQVTQFVCGGFVIGLVFNHAIADGLGMGQFMNAVAEVARGLADPTVVPVWCRDAIPDPQRPRSLSEAPLPDLTPVLPTDGNRYFHIDISQDYINQLKQQFAEKSGRNCSTFDILTAKVWQCRARALLLEPEAQVRLVFATNARNLLGETLPPGGGYYGNCVYPMAVKATSGEIIHTSTAEIVELISAAKKRIPVEFGRWSRGESEEDPYKPVMDHDFLFMVDWTRLGFNGLDFGFGKTAYVAPLLPEGFPAAVSYIVQSPAPAKGVRLITHCVQSRNLAKFQDQMINAFSESLG